MCRFSPFKFLNLEMFLMSLKLFAGALVACISVCSVSLAQESTSSDKQSNKTGDNVLIVEIDDETGEYKVRPVDKNGGRVIHWIGDLAFQEKSNDKPSIETKLELQDDEIVLDASNLSKENVFVFEHGSDKKPKSGSSKKRAVWVTDTDQEIVVDGKKKIVFSPQTGKHLVWNQDDVVVTGDFMVKKQDDSKSKQEIPAEVQKLLKEHGIVIAELDNLDIDIKRLNDDAKHIIVKAEKNDKGNVEKKVINVQVRRGDQPIKSGKYRLQEQQSPSDNNDLAKRKKTILIEKRIADIEQEIDRARAKIANAKKNVVVKLEKLHGKNHAQDEKHSHDKKHVHVHGHAKVDGHQKGHNVVFDGHNIIVDGKKIVVDGKHIVIDGKNIVVDGKAVDGKAVDGRLLRIAPHQKSDKDSRANELVLDLAVDGDLDHGKSQIRKGYRVIQHQSGNEKVHGTIVREKGTQSFHVAPADPSVQYRWEKSDKVKSDKPAPSQNKFRVKLDPAKVQPSRTKATTGSFQQQMNRLERRMNSLEKKLDLVLKRIGR